MDKPQKMRLIVKNISYSLLHPSVVKEKEINNLNQICKYSVRGHSTTTWTEFCHFLTPSPPHVVHVVIEWLLISSFMHFFVLLCIPIQKLFIQIDKAWDENTQYHFLIIHNMRLHYQNICLSISRISFRHNATFICKWYWPGNVLPKFLLPFP